MHEHVLLGACMPSKKLLPEDHLIQLIAVCCAVRAQHGEQQALQSAQCNRKQLCMLCRSCRSQRGLARQIWQLASCSLGRPRGD